MTDVLALTTTFDFSGSGEGDEEDFAIFSLDEVLAWLDGDVDAGEELEEKCRFITDGELDGSEADELRAGKIVELTSEQTQIVLAPVVANDGETISEAFDRIQADAGEAMKGLCDYDSDHPWD